MNIFKPGVPIAVIKHCGQRQLVVHHPGSQGRNMETGAGAKVIRLLSIRLLSLHPGPPQKAGTAYVSN